MSVYHGWRVACVAALIVLFSTTTAYAQKWVRLAPFPEPAEEVYGIGAGGKLYVFGGLAPGWTPIGMVYEYDPAADRWTKKKNMPLASHATFRKVEAYEPRTNTWHTLPPMEFARHGLAGDIVGNRLHLVSGDIQSGGAPGAQIKTEAHEALVLPDR